MEVACMDERPFYHSFERFTPMQKTIPQSDARKHSFCLIFIFIFGGLILTSIFWGLYSQSETGFMGKTLWDWLDLFLVPILLVLLIPGAYWLVQKAQERQKRIEFEIALDNHREKAMQSYMENLTALIFEKGLGTREGSDG
jgi:hypothetical protein